MALLGEMRRRNIFKVSLAYAIVSWLVVQIADVILPTFNAPQWVMQVLVLMLILVFPIAVLLSWAYELTPEGFKATADVDKTQSITVKTGRKLNHIVIGLLVAAIVFLVFDNYVLEIDQEIEADLAYRQTIAVIPFVNRSESEENAEFFSDGIHDELLTRLSRISDLRVISRTSVMEYRDTTKNIRQIGEELGVGSILEGGVQRAGDEVRINVQLIDARTDEHIWADTYDSELNAANVFAIQSEISTAIAEALEATLSPAERKQIGTVPTENLEALEAYFTGKHLLEDRRTATILSSIEFFEQAVALDPRFGDAWAGIAEAWLELPNYSATADPHRVRREAASAAVKAITSSPESPKALAVLGWHMLLHNYDWSGAEAAFRTALDIEATNVNALHWYSHLLSWQGRHDDALAAAEIAFEADPLSRLILTNKSYILADARRWDEAIELADQLVTDDPYTSLAGNLWIAKMRARRPEDAAAQLLNWANVTGRSSEAAMELGELIIRAQGLGEVVELTTDLIERLQVGTEVPEIYAALGDAENTIASLQNAHLSGTGFRSLLSMRINPSYDFVRDDPRFIELLEEIGLSD
jgi:TolB-like protein/Tfp pilus assembly protein PilF